MVHFHAVDVDRVLAIIDCESDGRWDAENPKPARNGMHAKGLMQHLDGYWPSRAERAKRAGFPDLVLIRPPRVLFLELKRQTGRLSPIQREVIDQLDACPGVEVQVARPSDWEQVCSWLA